MTYPIFAVRYPLFIAHCIALHLIWATLLVLDSSSAGPAGATAPSGLYNWFGEWSAIILVTVAVLAGVPLLMRLRGLTPAVLMLPQQAVLMITAGSALVAMISGHFADGVPRPHTFIIADQTPAVIAAIFHTIAIIGNSRRFSWSD